MGGRGTASDVVGNGIRMLRVEDNKICTLRLCEDVSIVLLCSITVVARACPSRSGRELSLRGEAWLSSGWLRCRRGHKLKRPQEV